MFWAILYAVLWVPLVGIPTILLARRDIKRRRALSDDSHPASES